MNTSRIESACCCCTKVWAAVKKAATATPARISVAPDRGPPPSDAEHVGDDHRRHGARRTRPTGSAPDAPPPTMTMPWPPGRPRPPPPADTDRPADCGTPPGRRPPTPTGRRPPVPPAAPGAAADSHTMAACRSSRPESMEISGSRSAISGSTPPAGDRGRTDQHPATTAPSSTASAVASTRGRRRRCRRRRSVIRSRASTARR